MQRVYFYSDESKDGARFVVAGVAISAHANVIRKKLLRAERSSGKGISDWHKTKDPKTRHRYLQEVLNIAQLRDCAFSWVYEGQPGNQFEATVTALESAIDYFGQGKQCVLIHEGFTHGTREKMKRRLKERGVEGVEVKSGSLENEPRVRLADALAGFSRLMRSGSAQTDALSDLRYDGWFVNLE